MQRNIYSRAARPSVSTMACVIGIENVKAKTGTFMPLTAGSANQYLSLGQRLTWSVVKRGLTVQFSVKNYPQCHNLRTKTFSIEDQISWHFLPVLDRTRCVIQWDGSAARKRAKLISEKGHIATHHLSGARVSA